MLGRTDSRPRARCSCSRSSSSFGRGLRGAPRLLAARRRHDWLVAQARDQVAVRTEIAAIRGTIYDRSGTVVLATTIRRDRLVAYPASLAGDTPAARTRRAGGRGNRGRDPRARRRRRRRAPPADRRRQGLRRPRPRPDDRPVERGPRRRRAGCAAAGRAWSRRRCASTRSRAAPPRRPSRLTCSGSSTARATASTASRAAGRTPLAGSPRIVARRARRRRATRPGAGRDAGGGQPGRRPHPHDRRQPAAGGGAARSTRPGSPTARRASRPWSWTRRPARSSPRPPTRPMTPTTTGAVADRRARALPGPGRRLRLRAGLRLQDGHRGGGPRGRRRQADVHASPTSRSSASTAARPPSERRQGSKGKPDLPGRASPGRATWSCPRSRSSWARPPRRRRSVLHGRGPSWASGTLSGVDLAGEVPGIVRDPARTTLAPDRRRQRLVRPGRRGDAPPAGDGLQRDGERGHPPDPARRAADRRGGRRGGRPRPGPHARRSRRARRDHEAASRWPCPSTGTGR